MSAGFVVAAVARSDRSESDGIHVMWTPPVTAGWSIDGWNVERRKAEGRKELRCHQLSAAELQTLHRILRLEFAFGEIRLRQADCPGGLPVLPTSRPTGRSPRSPRALPRTGPADRRRLPEGPPAPQRAGRPGQAAVPAASAFAAIGISTGPRKCAVYDIQLPERHRIVQVRAGLPAALAIALREGKAVDAQVLANPSGMQTARFENRDVDQVLVYCSVLATSLDICLEDLRDPEEEEAAWAGAELVAKGLQLPLRTLDGSLGSSQEEADLAKSRLFSDEDFDEEAFEALADLMNGVAADAKEAAPVWSSTVTREEPDDPFVEVRTWSYALALLVDPAWRRMLGFSVRDKDVEPGMSYDYRVTGRFLRRDVEERVHGFHAVPRGTLLPRRFALGDIALRTPEPVIVEQRPLFAAESLQASGRKGIPIGGDPGLTITFPSPVRSLVLEHDGGAGMAYRATTTDYFPGLPIHEFSDSVPAERRATARVPRPGARGAPLRLRVHLRDPRGALGAGHEARRRRHALGRAQRRPVRRRRAARGAARPRHRQPPAADRPRHDDAAGVARLRLALDAEAAGRRVRAGAVARRRRRGAAVRSARLRHRAPAGRHERRVRADRRQGLPHARVRLARRRRRAAAARCRRRPRARVPRERPRASARPRAHVARRRARQGGYGPQAQA